MKRRAEIVGKLRMKLCAMLIAEFKTQHGLDLRLQAERICPAEGRNRSDRRMDVYRWEAFGKVVVAGGTPTGISCTIDSWDTITACVRDGIGINRETGFNFDVYAAKTRMGHRIKE